MNDLLYEIFIVQKGCGSPGSRKQSSFRHLQHAILKCTRNAKNIIIALSSLQESCLGPFWMTKSFRHCPSVQASPTAD